jgi:cell division protein FtsQ
MLDLTAGRGLTSIDPASAIRHPPQDLRNGGVVIKGKLLKVLGSSFAVFALGFAGWCAYTAVTYIRTAPRYDVQKLAVSGLHRVAENEVIAKVGFEVGTNVFAADLDRIRERVEELDWVRHATVQRILPDQILINVVEREPIGLGRINGEIYQFDADAMILQLDGLSAASFPVLDGLRRADPARNLAKVQAYRRVLEELGQSDLSEVHVNDAGEVSLVSASDALLVNLGKEDFRNRWVRFLQLKPQIEQHYPGAVRVDLRFKNQVIIRMREDDAGEKIVWDGEKRAL